MGLLVQKCMEGLRGVWLFSDASQGLSLAPFMPRHSYREGWARNKIHYQGPKGTRRKTRRKPLLAFVLPFVSFVIIFVQPATHHQLEEPKLSDEKRRGVLLLASPLCFGRFGTIEQSSLLSRIAL